MTEPGAYRIEAYRHWRGRDAHGLLKPDLPPLRGQTRGQTLTIRSHRKIPANRLKRRWGVRPGSDPHNSGMKVSKDVLRTVDRMTLQRTFGMGYRSGRVAVTAISFLDPVPRGVKIRKGSAGGRPSLLAVPDGAGPAARRRMDAWWRLLLQLSARLRDHGGAHRQGDRREHPDPELPPRAGAHLSPPPTRTRSPRSARSAAGAAP